MVPSGLQFENKGNSFFSFFSSFLFQGVKVTEGHTVHAPTTSSNTLKSNSPGPEIMKQFKWSLSLHLWLQVPPGIRQSILVTLRYCTDPSKGNFSDSLLSVTYCFHSRSFRSWPLFHKTSILILYCHFSKTHTAYFILAYFNANPLKWIPKAVTVILSGIYLPVLFPLRLRSLIWQDSHIWFFSYSQTI